MSLGGDSVSFGGEPAKPKKSTRSSGGQTASISFGGEPSKPKQAKTTAVVPTKPTMVSSATGIGPQDEDDEVGLIKLGDDGQDHLYDRPVLGDNQNEVMISCKLDGESSNEDDYVDFGKPEGQETMEMGTSYDPPPLDENQAPNVDTTANMLRILEQEMQKGFGGGVPSFLQGEVKRLTAAKEGLQNQVKQVKEQKEEMKAGLRAEARREAAEEQEQQKQIEETKKAPGKKKKGRANGEGWEEFKEPKKKDDGGKEIERVKANLQFERYYKQLGVVPATEWYDFYALLKEPLDICFRINSIE